MANGMNFAELLKEVCEDAINDNSLADKGYELEPKSYYTTYYGQDVATVGTARGYYRYVNDFHVGASGRSDRTIKLANPFEVDLV